MAQGRLPKLRTAMRRANALPELQELELDIVDPQTNLPSSDREMTPRPIQEGSYGVVYKAMVDARYTGVTSYAALKMPKIKEETLFEGENDLIIDTLMAEINMFLAVKRSHQYTDKELYVVRLLGYYMENPVTGHTYFQELGYRHIRADWKGMPGTRGPESPVILGLVFEWCNGGDLAGAITPNPFSEDQTLVRLRTYLLDATRGLFQLRSSSIVHRDIKPDNILLCTPVGHSSHEYVAKVADLGTAHLVSDTGMMNTEVGTAGYFPLGTTPAMLYDHRANHLDNSLKYAGDMYALGVTALHLFYPAEFHLPYLSRFWMGSNSFAKGKNRVEAYTEFRAALLHWKRQASARGVYIPFLTDLLDFTQPKAVLSRLEAKMAMPFHSPYASELVLMISGSRLDFEILVETLPKHVQTLQLDIPKDRTLAWDQSNEVSSLLPLFEDSDLTKLDVRFYTTQYDSSRTELDNSRMPGLGPMHFACRDKVLLEAVAARIPAHSAIHVNGRPLHTATVCQ